MTKKTTELANPRTSADLSFGEQDAAAATQLGIVLGGTLQDRITRAVMAYNMATRMAVEVGYLLLSVKADLPHGEFEEGIQSLGLAPRRAADLMRMAKFATALPETQRAELLNLPKSKVLALASADAEVIADLLDEGDVEGLSDLSVRELRQRIRDLEASHTDLSVERDTAQTERDDLAKRLKRRDLDGADARVPLVVADQRQEIAALLHKAQLALRALHPLGVEIVNLRGHDDAGQWVEPSLRLALAGLLATREELDGVVGKYAQALDDRRTLMQPADALSFMDDAEVKAVAAEYASQIALHEHEAALRQHGREAARPKGKGRPKAAPELPTAATKSRKA